MDFMIILFSGFIIGWISLEMMINGWCDFIGCFEWYNEEFLFLSYLV